MERLSQTVKKRYASVIRSSISLANVSRNNRLTLINRQDPIDTGLIANLYREAFRTFDRSRIPPEISVEFYPYVGINHTIRIRNGRAFVRLSTICYDMPHQVHRGLAYILVAKLMRRRVPKDARDIYSDYVKSPEIRERAVRNKKSHGRKVVSTHKGEKYDLSDVFDRLNKRYFNSKLPKPTLTWSARKTYRILAHHDSTHDTIVVSKSLDADSVPKFVLEYIVFHEMLHILHPTVHHNGRRYNHTAAFRADEERFEFFEEAENWIENSIRRLKREAKKRS